MQHLTNDLLRQPSTATTDSALAASDGANPPYTAQRLAPGMRLATDAVDASEQRRGHGAASSRWPTLGEAAVGALALLGVASGQALPAPSPAAGLGRRSRTQTIAASGGSWDLGRIGGASARLTVEPQNNVTVASVLMASGSWHHQVSQAARGSDLNFSIAAQSRPGLDLMGIAALQMQNNGTDIYALNFDVSPGLSAIAGLTRDPLSLVLGAAGVETTYQPGDVSYLTVSYNGTGGLGMRLDNSTGAIAFSARRLNQSRSTIDWIASDNALAPAPSPSSITPSALASSGTNRASFGLSLSPAITPELTTVGLSTLQRNVSYSLGELDGVSVTVDRFRQLGYEFLTFGFSCASWHHQLAFAQNETFSGFELRNANQSGLTLLGVNATAVGGLPKVAGQAFVPNFGQKSIASLGTFADSEPGSILLMANLRPTKSRISCEHTTEGWRIRVNGSDQLLVSGIEIALPQPQILPERSRIYELNELYPAATSSSLG